jgi:hypothetical protein
MIIHLIAWATAFRDIFNDAQRLRSAMRRKHGFIPE